MTMAITQPSYFVPIVHSSFLSAKIGVARRTFRLRMKTSRPSVFVVQHFIANGSAHFGIEPAFLKL
jgi:hypothetical protein